MKRLKRKPLEYDAFTLLAEYARASGISLKRAATAKRLGRALVDSVKKYTKNPAFLYGQRAEALFEMIVVMLGKARLIKREDIGPVYHAPDISVRAPDFRLVLQDGRQVLVEVKNCNAEMDFREDTADYIETLRSYANETKCDLYYAIQWVRWQAWTLVHHSRLIGKDNKVGISFADAMTANEMAIVGDRMIGTRAPLRFRAEFLELSSANVKRRRRVHNLQVKGPLKLFSEDRQLTDPVELSIAFAFMLYGRWKEHEKIELDDEKKVKTVEYIFAPPEEIAAQQTQGFDLVASLSGLISKMYREQTMKANEIVGILANFEPGALRQFIPTDYHQGAHNLPLWVFTMMPGPLGNSQQHSIKRTPEGSDA